MKNFTFAIALAACVVTASAQEGSLPAKHSVATNSFGSNWFVELGGNYNVAYTSQGGGVNASPFSHKRGSFGFNAGVGKWFTPELALRTAVDLGWARNTSGSAHELHPTASYMYIHQDVVMNLTNLLMGYDAERRWNMSPYVGMGYVRNFSEDVNKLGMNMGVRNSFRILPRMDAFADVQVLFTSSLFLGAKGNNSTSLLALNHYDKVVSLKFGVTYDISKQNGWNHAYDLAEIAASNREQMEIMERMVNEERLENDRLRQLLAADEPVVPVVETRIVKESQVLSTVYSVFFNHDSHEIASRKDLVNLNDLVAYAKAGNRKLLVTGYADSNTGDKPYNQALSERRAQTIVAELVKMGVPRQNIVVKAAGGVDLLSPYNYNRRATVVLQ